MRQALHQKERENTCRQHLDAASVLAVAPSCSSNTYSIVFWFQMSKKQKCTFNDELKKIKINQASKKTHPIVARCSLPSCNVQKLKAHFLTWWKKSDLQHVMLKNVTHKFTSQIRLLLWVLIILIYLSNTIGPKGFYRFYIQQSHYTKIKCTLILKRIFKHSVNCSPFTTKTQNVSIENNFMPLLPISR